MPTPHTRFLPGVVAVVLAPLIAGCPPRGVATTTGVGAGAIRFEEVASSAGLKWTHAPCRTGKKLLPETYGGGGGFLDLNGDGLLDIILINGAPLPGYRGSIPRHALYLNRGDGTFVDATDKSGLRQGDYGMGVATGDLDNDGWTDLFVTGLHQNRLYRNDRGRLVEITATAGVGKARWSTGATFLDYDGDGLLDLFVANYVRWPPAREVPCGRPGHPEYCPPLNYEGAPPVLYKNLGNGRFRDVSAETGVLGHPTKSLAVLVLDVNDDGRPDLFVANDTEPDVLLVNRDGKSFEDRAISAGVAHSARGGVTGSMGIDAATPYADGRLALAVGTFVAEGMSFFLRPQAGPEVVFDHIDTQSGLNAATLSMSTFGLLFADLDADGHSEIVALNGHLDEVTAAEQSRQPYRQPPQVFQLRDGGNFTDVAPAAGIDRPLVGRALASADYDGDGRLDLLAFENGGPVRLWHNIGTPAGDFLRIQLVGRRSPRDGTGATVRVRRGASNQARLLTTARSYLAANDPVLHFGLPRTGDPVDVEVRWPSGATTGLRGVVPNQLLRIEEEPRRPQ